MIFLDSRIILQSFNGVAETDFAANDRTGTEIIQDEIDLQSSSIFNYLDSAVVRMINNGAPLHVPSAPCIATIPPYVGQKYIRLLGYPNCLEAYIVTRQQLESIRTTQHCNPCSNLADQFPVFTDFIIDNDLMIFNDPNFDQLLMLTYKFNLVSVKSLQNALRNMVCCNLGYQLFSAGDQVWKLVEHYCKLAEEFRKKYQDKKFIPNEFNSVTWISGSPFNTGMASFRMYRSN